MNDSKPSRRSLLINSASGMSAAWLASHWPDILEAQEHAQTAMRSSKPVAWGYFTPEQAVETEAMAAQIIPTDDTPGAREAGVIHFIDRVLVTFDRDQEHVYREGLGELQAKTAELFPSGGKFSALSAPQQVQVLTALEETPFFRTVRNHTVIGFFASPVHGGNGNKVGWELIGYDDSLNHEAPFGYYDKLMEANER